MVVIAIISLLVSILLPSLQKAKELAQGAMCQSNMRSLMIASMTYVNEYDGYVPTTLLDPVDWHTILDDHYWYNVVRPMFGEKRYTGQSNWNGKRIPQLLCPADEMEGGPVEYNENPVHDWRRHSFNISWGTRRGRAPRKLKTVKRPAETMCFGEQDWHISGGTRAIWYDYDYDYLSERAPVRHSNKLSLGMFDGHVEAMDREEFLDQCLEKSDDPSITTTIWGTF